MIAGYLETADAAETANFKKAVTTDSTDLERQNHTDTATATAKCFVKTVYEKAAGWQWPFVDNGVVVAVPKALRAAVSVKFPAVEKSVEIRGHAFEVVVLRPSAAICGSSASRAG